MLQYTILLLWIWTQSNFLFLKRLISLLRFSMNNQRVSKNLNQINFALISLKIIAKVEIVSFSYKLKQYIKPFRLLSFQMEIKIKILRLKGKFCWICLIIQKKFLKIMNINQKYQRMVLQFNIRALMQTIRLLFLTFSMIWIKVKSLSSLCFLSNIIGHITRRLETIGNFWIQVLTFFNMQMDKMSQFHMVT